MDLWLLIQAFIMGLVEGITEFLPISSTGHLIITATLLDFWTKEKRDVFEVAIQLGAILSVCYEYRERLINVTQGLFQNKPEAWRFSINVAIAFLPAAILGFLTIHAIKEHLFNSVSVAIALIVGGFIILWAEKRPHQIRINNVDDMQPLDALKVGLAQCAALFPGTSRSGATIIGGLLFGLSRKVAAEFSFFLAIPTMFAASGYDLLKEKDNIHSEDIKLLLFGAVVAFIVAFFAIKAFINFLTKYGFKHFGYYRIALGILFLVYALATGIQLSA